MKKKEAADDSHPPSAASAPAVALPKSPKGPKPAECSSLQTYVGFPGEQVTSNPPLDEEKQAVSYVPR